MGVTGLWQIIDSVGHPIKLEGLEGKRLGVDASVWLYKFLRGFREKDNASTNIEGHKLGLFNRICKLLFYKIKPVFVFDGPAPILKRKTLERRKELRSKELAKVQSTAIKLLGEQLKGQYPNADIEKLKIQLPELQSNSLVAAEKLTMEDRELFHLPPEIVDVANQSDSFDDSDWEDWNVPSSQTTIKQESHKRQVDNIVYHIDTDTDDDEVDKDKKFKNFTRKQIKREFRAQTEVDIDSEEFARLPAEIRYEILTDIRDEKKRIRRAGAMPEEAEMFSNFQMKRLKEKRVIQEKIEECEKEICRAYTGELGGSSVQSFRVHSDASATMLYGVKIPDLTKKEDVAAEKLKLELALSKRGTSLHEAKLNDTVDISDSEEDEDKDKPPMKIKKDSPRPNETVIITDSEEEEEEVSNKNKAPPKEESFYIPPQTAPSPDLSESSVDDEDWEDVIVPANSSAEKLKIQITELQSNSLVTAEKLTNENEELFHLSPEIVDIANQSDSSDNQQDCSIPSSQANNKQESPQRSQQKQQDNIVHHIDTDTEDDQEENKEVVKEGDKEKDENEKFVNFTRQQNKREFQEQDQEKVVTDSEELTRPSAEIFCENSDERKRIRRAEAMPEGAETISSSTKEDIEPTRPKKVPVEFDHNQLNEVIGKANRTTKKVTTKVVEEAKELLRLFGIPYIDAAGEAEAQCALLEKLKLTDGTITDDSDIWLFGSQNVYRHFFSDDKYVLQYKMSEIEFHIRMNRENLVCLAMLVGSDYTDGIMNVGPVTALEILSEFQGENIEPLIKFKEWRLKYSRSNNKIPGNKKRESFLKFRIPEEFPSRQVFDGYLRPMADTSTENFSWGTPDLDELREYARRNFNWDKKKIDDKLLPVMKKVNERQTQPTIDNFFFKRAVSQNPELFRSKRINQALSKIAGTSSQETEVMLTDDEEDTS